MTFTERDNGGDDTDDGAATAGPAGTRPSRVKSVSGGPPLPGRRAKNDMIDVWHIDLPAGAPRRTVAEELGGLDCGRLCDATEGVAWETGGKEAADRGGGGGCGAASNEAVEVVEVDGGCGTATDAGDVVEVV